MDPLNPLASVVVFQYNPDTLTRTIFAARPREKVPHKGEALRLKGPPHAEIFLLRTKIGNDS